MIEINKIFSITNLKTISELCKSFITIRTSFDVSVSIILIARKIIGFVLQNCSAIQICSTFDIVNHIKSGVDKTIVVCSAMKACTINNPHDLNNSEC
jgi:hypothetical protein